MSRTSSRLNRKEYHVSEHQDVSFHCNATLVPSGFGKDRRQKSGGVWTDSSCKNKKIFRVGRLKNLATASDLNPLGDCISSAVFAGYAINHFGHFLTESVGCLPNIPSTYASGSLMFLAGNRKSQRLNQWQIDLLRVLGWSGSAQVIDQPKSVENLVVPGISFHQNKTGYGDKAGLVWRNSVFPEEQHESTSRIYISRSKLDKRLGHFSDEKLLENTLRSHGFSILHPETMSVEAQIEAYKGASHVVLAESSAIHLLNLVCHSSQKIALLQRRPKVHGSILRATRYFARAQVVGINAISDFEGNTDEAWPEYRGVSTIDFNMVMSVLDELSYFGEPSFDRAEVSTQIDDGQRSQSSDAVTLLSRTWDF